jgi:O-6-methylguanine DNA methyltransferase
VPLHDRLERELDDYFQGRSTRFGLPLLYPGTPFQERVWSALLRIPYGSTWSYERLALEIGNPDAQRAVGTANGRNRISILIPCHRVINKSGALGGYGGGLERKQMLLELEARTLRSAASLLPPA